MQDAAVKCRHCGSALEQRPLRQPPPLGQQLTDQFNSPLKWESPQPQTDKEVFPTPASEPLVGQPLGTSPLPKGSAAKNDLTNEGQKAPLRPLIGGALQGTGWVVLAGVIWFSVVGNPTDDLLLLLYARTAAGQITNSWEDAGDRDDGHVEFYQGITYVFRLPDGRRIEGGWKGSGRLRADLVDIKDPVPVVVEYLAASPSVNRPQGSGSRTLFEWATRHVVGLSLLALLALPGVQMIRKALQDWRAQNDRLPAARA
jgi:hypothetical protein